MAQRDVPEWFSFYVYEFLCDGRVAAMTIAQIGAYVILLCRQWIDGSIPADISEIARLLKQTPEATEVLWAGVAPCFSPHPAEAGRLIQLRLEAERAVTMERVEKAREKMRSKRVRERSGNVTEQIGNVPEPCTVLSLIHNQETTSKSKEVDAWFDSDFWPLYPRKVAKPDAIKAARKHGATEAQRAAIIAGLKAQLPALRKSHADGFCPYPASWLNAERWNDEATPAESAPSVVSTMDPETRRRIEERRKAETNG